MQHPDAVRATQFHEFVAQVLGQSSLGPLALVPQFRTQPVAAREVAEALVDAVEAGPQGRIPDLAGPRAERLKELAAAYVRKGGQRKLVLEFTAPGPLAGHAERRTAPGGGCRRRPPDLCAVAGPGR